MPSAYWPKYRRPNEPKPKRTAITMKEIAAKYGVSYDHVRWWRVIGVMPDPVGTAMVAGVRSMIFNSEEVAKMVEELGEEIMVRGKRKS